jgi:hypothetical protein
MRRDAVHARPSLLAAGPIALALCLAPLALTAPACGPPVDLKQALQVVDTTGGWFDAGVVEGKNKLVPTVTFRVKKIADVDVRPLSLNVLYRAIDGKESDIDQEVYLQSVAFEGDTSPPLNVRAPNGYTADAPQTRAEMLRHTQFRDMRAIIYAKHSSSNWVELAHYDIPRQLVTK